MVYSVKQQQKSKMMAGFLSNLFKLQDSVDFEVLLQNGAVVLDVRTKEEYRSGCAENSLNIPLDQLSANFRKLSLEKPIIVVCQSGMRSKNAVGILRRKGYKEVYNGGGWHNFKK